MMSYKWLQEGLARTRWTLTTAGGASLLCGVMYFTGWRTGFDVVDATLVFIAVCLVPG